MRKSIFLKPALAVAMLLSVAAANAEITAYNSQAGYLAAVGTTGVDNFDDVEMLSNPGPAVRNAGDFAYTLTAGPEVSDYWGATDDGVDWWLSTGYSHDSITFSDFGTDVAGAGGFFFGSGYIGQSLDIAAIHVTATDGTGATLTFTIDAPTVNSFVGFVSDTYLTSLTVWKDNIPDTFVTVNDLHLSVAAVPEPATYGMLLAGLGLVGYAGRRARRKA